MEVTHKELVESKETREKYKDFLVEEVGILLTIQEQDEKEFLPGLPTDLEALKLWENHLECEHYSAILAILSEHENDPQLEEILDEEEKEYGRRTKLAESIDFIDGFKAGFKSNHNFFKNSVDQIFTECGLMEGIEKRKQLREMERVRAKKASGEELTEEEQTTFQAWLNFEDKK